MTFDAVGHESILGHVDFGPVRFPVVVEMPEMLPELELLGFTRTDAESGAAAVDGHSSAGGRIGSAARSGSVGRVDSAGRSGPARHSDDDRFIGPTIVVRPGSVAGTTAGSNVGSDSDSGSDHDTADQATKPVGQPVEVENVEVGTVDDEMIEIEILEVDYPGGSSDQGSVSTPATRYGARVPCGGRFDSCSGAAHAVLSVMTERVVRAEPDWVHLHASAVSVHGFGIVIPAASGSGKTTLATELGSLGGVLTDELVAVDRVSGLLRAPKRPLSVKASGFGRVVTRHWALSAPPAGGPVWHVPLDVIGLGHVDAISPHVVALPHRRPGAVTITSADPGEVLMALIANSYDLDVDPERAFGDLVWLASTCHGVHLTYGDANDVGSVLSEWISVHDAPRAQVATRVDRVDDGVLAVATGIGEVRWQPSTREVAWVRA